MAPESASPGPESKDAGQQPGHDGRDGEQGSRDLDAIPSRSVTHVMQYSGPIPTAEELARYEDSYPGSADRIFSMAEREQADTVSFRTRSLLAATAVAIATIAAIAFILTTNPNAIVLIALALVYALPPVTDFIHGIYDALLSKKERELELQIRKDNHELDMAEARQRLQLGSGLEDTVSQRASRLEAGDESTESSESSQ